MPPRCQRAHANGDRSRLLDRVLLVGRDCSIHHGQIPRLGDDTSSSGRRTSKDDQSRDCRTGRPDPRNQHPAKAVTEHEHPLRIDSWLRAQRPACFERFDDFLSYSELLCQRR
jgi:hypothetical protein